METLSQELYIVLQHQAPHHIHKTASACVGRGVNAHIIMLTPQYGGTRLVVASKSPAVMRLNLKLETGGELCA
jgi:hypothetical protein